MTNKRTGRVCVIGSANIDLTFRTPRFPHPGETLTGSALHQCMGGKGANQAVAAARLGAQVTFVACVGDDAFGTTAVDHYQAEGIDTSYIRQVARQATGTAAIVVDDQAENYIIVIPGANADLTCDDIHKAANVIANSDAVVCQLETPLAVTHEAFRIARAANVRTVLTPAPVIPLTDELLSLCDLCIPNRTEIETLVGMSVQEGGLDEAHEAAKRLLDRGVRSVALTLGSSGALMVDRAAAVHIPAVQVKAVDTTGAGDAFSAALVVGLCEGLSLQSSAQRASLVAALSVTRMGTQTSFPHRAEVDGLRLP